VDAAGNVYLTGVTGSTNFPVTADAFQKTKAGLNSNAYVVVLAPDLSHLIYSSYLGGSNSNNGRGGHADANGNFYFGGETNSSDFPVVNAYQPVMHGTADAFVAKMSKSSTSPIPPSIVAQPASKSVAAGQTATFSVTASGTSPLQYQWQRNGTNIAGAVSVSYTTPATVLADNGATFRVVVSNSAGSATSSSATLTVDHRFRGKRDRPDRRVLRQHGFHCS
jgi:hypothetical protein